MNYVPPIEVVESLTRYVEHRVPPGDFLEAVLSNDLRESFGSADENNLTAMCEIVAYCLNNIPTTCWGSPERVREWLNPAPKASEEAI